VSSATMSSVSHSSCISEHRGVLVEVDTIVKVAEGEFCGSTAWCFKAPAGWLQ
jgi:hypothetical protein